MTSQMDTAIAAARQLDDQASDYGDEVADDSLILPFPRPQSNIGRAMVILADC